MFLLTISAIILAGQVVSHSSYMDDIPNGHKVPNPKSPGSFWGAVGHDTPDDGSGLNKFGEDYKHAGKRWTTQLCQMDSDGDGKTNGAELGDPNCQWKAGGTPSGPATGHPGYADNTGTQSGGFHGITVEQPLEATTQGEEHHSGEHHHSGEKEHEKEHEKDHSKEHEKEHEKEHSKEHHHSKEDKD